MPIFLKQIFAWARNIFLEFSNSLYKAKLSLQAYTIFLHVEKTKLIVPHKTAKITQHCKIYDVKLQKTVIIQTALGVVDIMKYRNFTSLKAVKTIFTCIITKKL